MTKEELKYIQGQIGYKFTNISLLHQAFKRRSYAKENGGQDNEVLEFLGDKVLDFVVVKLLAEKYGKLCSEIPNKEFRYDEFVCEYNEDKLTKLKSKLVQKKTLAERTDQLGIAKFLVMGNSDTMLHMEDEASVKEDLFEAILGAIAIDSEWNQEALQSAIEIMLNPDLYLSKGEEKNYVSLVQEWCTKKYKEVPWYYYDKTDMESSWLNVFNGPQTHAKPGDCFYCILKLGEKMFKGYGKSKSDARKDVCELAYSIIKSNGEQLSIKDEIESPNEFDAINQLEILARRGYFSIPTYEFREEKGASGNPIWLCICRIAEFKNEERVGVKSSKTNAKKEAAYQMLLYVLDNYKED